MKEKNQPPLTKVSIEPKTTHHRAIIQDILHLITHSDATVAINDGLRKVMSYFGADRVYLGFFNKENSSLSFLYEVSTSGKVSLNDFLESRFGSSRVIHEEDFPYWVGSIKQGTDLIFSDVKEMPKEAYREQSVMRKSGISSSIVTSIYADGEVQGFMGVEYVNRPHSWKKSEIERVHFFSDLFSILVKNKQMKKAIKESSAESFKSNAIFKIIFDALPVGIELYDENGYLINVNPYDLKILGAEKEDLLGINLFENPSIPKKHLDSIRNGKETTFENDYHYNLIKEQEYYQTSNVDKVMRLIGKCIPLRGTDDKVFGYILLVHHHTSYYQEKEKLHDSLQKLKMSINSANSYIWEYDVKENTINIDFSLLDYEQNEFVQPDEHLALTNKEAHIDRIHSDDKNRIIDQANQIIRGEILSFTDTYRQHLNGKLNWYTTYFHAYKYDENNKPTTIICLTRNVTKKREDELALLREKEANRIKSAFINNMSHELRTPLNAIVGFSNILADLNDTEENSYFIDIIRKNNDILLQIIDSILSFSKIKNNTLQYTIEDVNIKDICKEAINIKSSNRKEHIQLNFDENLPSVMVRTDRDRIVQVLFHLLDNAYKFAEEGSVTVHYTTVDEKELRIEITDTGIGMTEEEIAKIYKSFYKANEFQVGLGLGLSISKKMVENMGGSVGVSSIKGEGTTFWFHLPLVANEEIGDC